MELAAYAAKKENLTIHVVGMDSVPLAKILGDDIGAGLKKFHEKNGVIFHMDSGIEKYIPSSMSRIRPISDRKGQHKTVDVTYTMIF